MIDIFCLRSKRSGRSGIPERVGTPGRIRTARLTFTSVRLRPRARNSGRNAVHETLTHEGLPAGQSPFLPPHIPTHRALGHLDFRHLSPDSNPDPAARNLVADVPLSFRHCGGMTEVRPFDSNRCNPTPAHLPQKQRVVTLKPAIDRPSSDPDRLTVVRIVDVAASKRQGVVPSREAKRLNLKGNLKGVFTGDPLCPRRVPAFFGNSLFSNIYVSMRYGLAVEVC